ncbi:hypothetical protein [Nonomuraea sp. B19D2]|uniref:hypothetical protein n=1 Tax=Nonomuraea sp. B19D2 TaxID=3159561 RepID=UPI0032D9D44C
MREELGVDGCSTFDHEASYTSAGEIVQHSADIRGWAKVHDVGRRVATEAISSALLGKQPPVAPKVAPKDAEDTG